MPIQGSVSPQAPLHHSSWRIPSETGSALDISTAGSSPQPLAYASTTYDQDYRGSYDYGWEFPAHARGYDAHVLEHHPGLRFAPSQFIRGPRGTLSHLFPRIRAYEIIYTDDARMKIGDRVRRQCFNCRAIQTTTWRRSKLSQGKLVCLSDIVVEIACLK